ncbi:hypothetical protein niasHT_021176 [Heterodera trifolii]|uniref:BHLH domain-containing protein n=1 Tax=Heterodera trifolii TaxID=157864 RepID=A0ABD2JF79_9BILA
MAKEEVNLLMQNWCLRHLEKNQKQRSRGTGVKFGGKKPHQVARRNERERKRVQQMNSEFETLASKLSVSCQAFFDKKLTKAQTLKAAILYIRHLERILSSEKGEGTAEEEFHRQCLAMAALKDEETADDGQDENWAEEEDETDRQRNQRQNARQSRTDANAIDHSPSPLSSPADHPHSLLSPDHSSSLLSSDHSFLSHLSSDHSSSLLSSDHSSSFCPLITRTPFCPLITSSSFPSDQFPPSLMESKLMKQAIIQREAGGEWREGTEGTDGIGGGRMTEGVGEGGKEDGERKGKRKGCPPQRMSK